MYFVCCRSLPLVFSSILFAVFACLLLSLNAIILSDQHFSFSFAAHQHHNRRPFHHDNDVPKARCCQGIPSMCVCVCVSALRSSTLLIKLFWSFQLAFYLPRSLSKVSLFSFIFPPPPPSSLYLWIVVLLAFYFSALYYIHTYVYVIYWQIFSFICESLLRDMKCLKRAAAKLNNFEPHIYTHSARTVHHTQTIFT